MKPLHELTQNAKEKARTAIQSAIKKATPVVKREIHKTMTSTAEDIQAKVFTGLTIGGLIFAFYGLGTPSKEAIKKATDVASRVYYTVNNEVKVDTLTYNIYLGGN